MKSELGITPNAALHLLWSAASSFRRSDRRVAGLLGPLGPLGPLGWPGGRVAELLGPLGWPGR